MFRAELVCGSCGFASDSFILGYHPPSDSVDFVLQSLSNDRFRVVSCNGITSQSQPGSLTEKELDAIVEGLSQQVKTQDEELLNVWMTPDEFPKRKCPNCHDSAVGLNLLSIL